MAGISAELLRQLQQRTKPAKEKSLSERLLASSVYSNFHDRPRKYAPANSIQTLITQNAIENELDKINDDIDKIEDDLVKQFAQEGIQNRRDIASWIATRAQKIFAICVTFDFSPQNLLISLLLFYNMSTTTQVFH